MSAGRLPDFLLVGAMRAGTTTLHQLLARHPRVFLPEEELFFLDADDFEEHAESFVEAGRWRLRDFDTELESALPAYRARFAPAGPDRLAGEDSTTYLTAEAAPARAARLLPEARIVAILRDPVDRAWSHYWHLVGSGRAVFDFDTTLIASRGTLLKRSVYPPAIRRWQAAFAPDRILWLLFEDMVHDLQGTVDRVCGFLGLESSLDVNTLPPEVRHQHKGRAFGRPAFRRLASWIAREGGGGPTLPIRRPTGLGGLLTRLAGTAAPPKMPEETRVFLEGLLGRANADVPALLGRPVSWPCLGTPAHFAGSRQPRP